MLNYLFAEVWDIDRTNVFINWFYSPEFFFGIAKYAICIMTGVIVAYFVCTKEGERLGVNKDDVLVCLTIVLPLAILGARIWYMCGDGVPSFKNYMDDYGFFKAVLYIVLYTIGFEPVSMVYMGLSGLAIHGGIVVAAIMIFVCCKWKKFQFTCILDMVAPGFLFGQMFGRWGNFFNQEAHGTVVGGWDTINNCANLTLAEQYETLTKTYLVPPFIAKNMRMYNQSYYYGVVDGVQKWSTYTGENFFHPTFLYESLLNFIGLILYFILRRTKIIRSGYFAGLYLIWYGIVRFFIEFIRTDSLYVGNTGIKSAQLTSIVMVVIGILLILYLRFIYKSERYKDILEKIKRAKESAQKELKEEGSSN